MQIAVLYICKIVPVFRYSQTKTGAKNDSFSREN